MDNRTPPLTGITAPTPARPTQNRDAGRARVARAISHLLRIGYEALCQEEAAEAEAARQVALDDGVNQDSIIQGEGDTTNGPQQHTG